MNGISVELTVDNLEKVLEEFAEQVDVGLEKIGMQAERHAKQNITANGTIDTGLLRNSITYAVSGNSPELQGYQNTGYSKRRNKSVPMISGSYSGTVGTEADKAVYIGTNVEYAPYVEYGHQQYGGGGHVPAKPFIRPAAADHNDEYEKIMRKALIGNNNG